MSRTVNINSINPVTFEYQTYSIEDDSLIFNTNVDATFNPTLDIIEYFVYDAGNNLLNTSYSYKDFKLPNTSFVNTNGFLPIIEIDPVKDLQNLGYSSGEFKVQYNIFKNKISSFPSASLFVKEISPDRTEIRAGSVVLTNDQIINSLTTPTDNIYKRFDEKTIHEKVLEEFNKKDKRDKKDIELNNEEPTDSKPKNRESLLVKGYHNLKKSSKEKEPEKKSEFKVFIEFILQNKL